MVERGAEVYYYDILGEDRNGTGASFFSLGDLVETCDILLARSIHSVLEVAEEAAAFLGPGKIYTDFNSTSPAIKISIAETVQRSQADFVDVAILSAVGAVGAKASILVTGPSADAFCETMRHLGLCNVQPFSGRYGDASMIKMLRSIFSKGIECLLVEILTAGNRAGVVSYLWEDIVGFMRLNSFECVAENWVRTHVTACDRRHHEMTQVVETMEQLGIEPTMARATEAFLRRAVTLEPSKRFPQGPDSAAAVGEFYSEMLR